MDINSLKARARYLGSPEQMYGVKRMTLDDGKAKGTSVFNVRSGAGLSYSVNADTGLDITELTYKGTDMYFLSKNGHHSPYGFNVFEDESMGTFPGGMMYTCGLLSVGGGNRCDGEWHPMHGRFHSTAAVCPSGRVDDNNVISVDGRIRETRLFGYELETHRTIETRAGTNEIILTDVITNQTCNPIGIMILYHTNFGYPFLSPDLEMTVNGLIDTQPRSDYAKEHIAECFHFTNPVDNDDEQVFFHTLKANDGFAGITLKNKKLHIGVNMSWSADTLPRVAQWKCMRSGEYVLGIEPTNTHLLGRDGEIKEGTIDMLQAYSSKTMQVKLSFFDI